MSAQTAYPVINLAETGRRIERQRRQAGKTVRDLQRYFGFEYPQAIYKWQHGECLPTVDNLLALARLLQVSMEDLLVYEDQEVFHFLWQISNYRFNANRGIRCYSKHVERETVKRSFPISKSGREPTVEQKAFLPGTGAYSSAVLRVFSFRKRIDCRSCGTCKPSTRTVPKGGAVTDGPLAEHNQ